MLLSLLTDRLDAAGLGAVMGLGQYLGPDRGLGPAPVTEGGLSWGVRLLLLLKREPLLPRLLRICRPADAPGLATARQHSLGMHLSVIACSQHAVKYMTVQSCLLVT